MQDRNRRTTPCIPIQLGQHYAGKVEPLIETSRRIDCILSCHGIYHKQNLSGFYRFLDPGNLRHHLFIDGQSSGRVDDDHVVIVLFGVVDGAACDVHSVAVFALTEHVDAYTLCHYV